MGSSVSKIKVPDAAGGTQFGAHLLDERHRDKGIFRLASSSGTYGALFGEQAKQNVFGDFRTTDPLGLLMQESPEEKAKKRKAQKTDAANTGAMARQQSMASGLSGGGIQSQMDTEAYGQVMQNYAAQAHQEQQAQSARQMQALQLVMMLYGFGGAGAAAGAASQGSGAGASYGSAGPGFYEVG